MDPRPHRRCGPHPVAGAAPAARRRAAGQTLVVCKVGGRSAQAAAYLQQQGHDVVNLDGGMLEWEAAGRPMVSDTGQAPQVV